MEIETSEQFFHLSISCVQTGIGAMQFACHLRLYTLYIEMSHTHVRALYAFAYRLNYIYLTIRKR